MGGLGGVLEGSPQVCCDEPLLCVYVCVCVGGFVIMHAVAVFIINIPRIPTRRDGERRGFAGLKGGGGVAVVVLKLAPIEIDLLSR